jgi:cytochrome c biogenesis protein CcdA
MPFFSIAPYLIAYLLGVATPVLLALLFFRGQDNERENSCFLIGLFL